MAFISIDYNPPPRTLRNFGFIGLVAFGTLAALMHYKMFPFGKFPVSAAPMTTYVFAGFAAYCGLFAVAAPAALRWLYITLTVVSFPIGFVMSYVVVSIMFFLIITPIGIIMRMMGRDALRLKFNAQATTHWIPRNPPASVKRYFRQF
ncbi:MAG: SxtJ family membrane protein [Planctomycetota bacterium]